MRDYYCFVTDNGKLRRYLFDSNIRDFLGLNRVNEDIKSTLENDNSPDFWWLNNGVTILTTKASVIGKSIQLQDIQIVNGLQTTQSIFKYFETGGSDPKERSVLIKIIVSSVDSVRDTIIRATNNQTDVELASLHATDKIQRDIEEMLERHGLYYERRKNYHVNLGRLPSDIITPLYLAAGYVNLVLKSPYKATLLKSRFMRSTDSYDMVFSTKTPIRVWPMIAKLLKSTDESLEKLRPTGSRANERFLKSWRQITCFLTVSRLMGTFDFSVNDIIQFDQNKITDIEIKSTWDFISSFGAKNQNGNGWSNRWNHKEFVNLCVAFSNEHKLEGIKRIEMSGFSGNDWKKGSPNRKNVSRDFAMKVNALLPAQPWKPGVHFDIMKALNCTKSEYFNAVEILIADGLRHRQKNGVVYDAEGNVLCFDQERVNPNTMKLLPKPDA